MKRRVQKRRAKRDLYMWRKDQRRWWSLNMGGAIVTYGWKEEEDRLDFDDAEYRFHGRGLSNSARRRFQFDAVKRRKREAMVLTMGSFIEVETRSP